jgi:hypothetical protein
MHFIPLAVLYATRLAWSPSTLEAAHLDHPAEPRPWRTYQWAYRDSSDGMSPLLELRIRECLERHLRASGFERTDPPELTIGFFLERPRGGSDLARESGSSARGPVGRIGRGALEPAGALVIDICEARTFRTVWRGVASRPIRPQGASRAEIENAVSSVMQGLPSAEEEPRSRRSPLAGYALS